MLLQVTTKQHFLLSSIVKYFILLNDSISISYHYTEYFSIYKNRGIHSAV